MVRWIQDLLAQFGLRIVRNVGRDAQADLKRLVPKDGPIVIFDVGANIGQSALEMRRAFPASQIHSFEPSPKSFAALTEAVGNLEGIFCWNLAFGAAAEKKPFFENSNSDMSSFWPLGEQAWGTTISEPVVEQQTIDQFCAAQGISHIHILKSDTQGYELEALKGAQQLLRQGNVDLILVELIFSDMYVGAAPAHDILKFLHDLDYIMVTLYPVHHHNGHASWTDGLFAHKKYLESIAP